MDTLVLILSDGKVSDEYMGLTNLITPSNTNEKVLGRFKHEFGSKPIEEFVFL